MQKHAESTRIPNKKRQRPIIIPIPGHTRISCGQCTVSTLDTSCPQFLQIARALYDRIVCHTDGIPGYLLIETKNPSNAMSTICYRSKVPKKSQENLSCCPFSLFIQVCRWRYRRAFEAVLHMSPPSVDAYSAAAKAGPGFGCVFSGASRNRPPVQTKI